MQSVSDVSSEKVCATFQRQIVIVGPHWHRAVKQLRAWLYFHACCQCAYCVTKHADKFQYKSSALAKIVFSLYVTNEILVFCDIGLCCV